MQQGLFLRANAFISLTMSYIVRSVAPNSRKRTAFCELHPSNFPCFLFLRLSLHAAFLLCSSNNQRCNLHCATMSGSHPGPVSIHLDQLTFPYIFPTPTTASISS